MKLISANEYHNKLKDEDMTSIKEVKMKYSKISRVFIYEQEVLQS